MKVFNTSASSGRPDEAWTKALVSRRDLVVGSGFALASALAHLVWNPMVEYWRFVASALLFTAFLGLWLVKEWRGLQLFVTRFYCIVALLDLLVEGVLQPVHHCTLDNLVCTGRMYLLFFGFWLLSQPVESWFWHRRRPAAGKH